VLLYESNVDRNRTVVPDGGGNSAREVDGQEMGGGGLKKTARKPRSPYLTKEDEVC